jgi:2-methylcitrate dehydratase PrpD
MNPLSADIATWVSRLTFEDLPADVVESTRLRVLDVVGLALAGSGTRFGGAVRESMARMHPAGPCHVLGTGEPLPIPAASLVNAALAQALEYDDTHIESIVHMSSPSVAAALALAETHHVDGRAAITAIALSNEIACRVGCVASGEFHKRGFHPTGLFAPFGVTFLAGKLLGLNAGQMEAAAGITGSFAAGLLECWVDGTESKFLHSGWAAQSGISAAFMAGAGATGPPRILEGRFGLFAAHLQGDVGKDFMRVNQGLGSDWESRRSSFKPFPAAHVLHPYISALLRLRDTHRLDWRRVAEIACPVPEYIVPIVCEPVAEKRAPQTGAHGRVCLQYTLAEALYTGAMGRTAYQDQTVRNTDILGLARRVRYYVDPDYPGPGRFKGAVEVTLDDGATLEEVEEHTRGSMDNPMSEQELRQKFDDNTSVVLSPAARGRLAEAILKLDTATDASALVALSMAH